MELAQADRSGRLRDAARGRAASARGARVAAAARLAALADVGPPAPAATNFTISPPQAGTARPGGGGRGTRPGRTRCTPSAWRKSSIVAPPAASPASAPPAPPREGVALRAHERPGGPQRMDPRAEQRLVGVDVPDAGDPALVEQERLDRRAAAAAEARSVAPSSSSDSGSSPRRAAKKASRAAAPSGELARPEAPRVAEAQLVRAAVEREAHAP